MNDYFISFEISVGMWRVWQPELKLIADENNQ